MTMLIYAALSIYVLAIGLSILLACAAAFWKPSRQTCADLPPLEGVTVVVPAMGSHVRLLRCLLGLARASAYRLEKVVVVLQSAPPQAPSEIIAHWKGNCLLQVVDMGANAGKALAITRGLREVLTEWVALVDSDVEVEPDFLDLLVSQAHLADAAYGVIASAGTGRRVALDAIVRADKAVSHGVWRLSRLALGLGPNIPGQCYVVRRSHLEEIYNGTFGHLDDLCVSLMLLAHGTKLAFVPAVVASEEGRRSWWGLLIQRARWTIGLLQAASVVLTTKPFSARSVSYTHLTLPTNREV